MTTDIFKNMSDGWNKIGHSVAKEFANIGAEIAENVTKNADKIAKGIDKGGLLGGLVETADVFSAGTMLTDTLDAFDVIPEDAALREGISAGINFTLGLGGGPLGLLTGTLLAAKDIADMSAISGTPSARPQSTERPHGCGGDPSRRAAREAAIEAAKSKQARAGAIEDAKDKIRARRDGYAAGYDAGFIGGYDSGYQARRNEELYGRDKTDEASNEIDKILRNPHLCFEDMIFALLRAVIKQGQKEVKEVAKDLKNGRDEDGQFKKDFKGLIDSKTKEIAGEKDPARKSDLQNDLQNLREERGEKLSERSDSRADIAENLKNLMSKLTEMQQALSNILNTQHEGAMSAIRNIK